MRTSRVQRFNARLWQNPNLPAVATANELGLDTVFTKEKFGLNMDKVGQVVRPFLGEFGVTTNQCRGTKLMGPSPMVGSAPLRLKMQVDKSQSEINLSASK